jgi:tetratricopeptide (TPR) repeat protein
MVSSPSIIQEFFKVRNEWEQADAIKSWRLAIWVLQYPDIDIVDKFLETERTIAGVFDDIFFRFDSTCEGDNAAFEKELWAEFNDWFLLPQNEKQDMYTALKNDGLLLQDFKPNNTLDPTAENLFKEILRFRACIKDADQSNFCLYFPPGRTDLEGAGNWFNSVLKKGVPNGIRLVTIDFAVNRKIKPDRKIAPQDVIELTPVLDMMAAIENEMDKAGSTYNTVGVDAQFRKQIRVVMNETVKLKTAKMDKEVNTLLSLGKQLNSVSATISSVLIAAQAYFSIGNKEKSEQHTDDAIKKASAAMEQQDPAGYPTWKASMMLKGALLVGNKKRKEAVEVYESLAKMAISYADSFSAMEGYRLSGHMLYELKKLDTAFENLLLALVAGSYMEIRQRRQSTFLHAAYLALHIGRQVKTRDENETVEKQLQEWLGDDWEHLLEQEGVVKAEIRRKKTVFG